MRPAIIGPGALGTMLAVKMAGAGPVLVDHYPERAAALDASPLVLEEDGRETACRVRVSAAPPPSSFDFVVITVKSHSVAAALERADEIVRPEGLVLCLANGIGHLDLLRKRQGPGACAAGVTAMGATLIRPGRARFGGAGETVIGPVSNREERKPLEAAAELFARAGMRVRVSPDIEVEIWKKLLVNVGINGLTAIHGCRNGEIAESPELAARLAAAVREAAAVAARLGVAVEGDPVEVALAVCRRTADNISSMLQDVRRGKRTEIREINGEIVRLAASLGLDAPVNREIVEKVTALEAAAGSHPPESS